MGGKQEQNGKAFEYAIIISAYELLQLNKSKVLIKENKELLNAKSKFDLLLNEQKNDFLKSANLGLNHIFNLEPKIKNSIDELIELSLQPDKSGSKGDVRDILMIRVSGYEMGISAKNNSLSIKSPRLSDKKDFFNNFGSTQSNYFKNEMEEIFSLLVKKKNENWSDFIEKENNVYAPVLTSLVAEIKRKISDVSFAINFMYYFLGNNDYYKLSNFKKEITIEALNFHDTLNHSFENITSINKIGICPEPKEIIETGFIDGNQKNKVFIVFDNGLKISLRIHNGDTKIRKSGLKLETEIEEYPTNYYKYLILKEK